jgi:thioredoxin-related protein
MRALLLIIAGTLLIALPGNAALADDYNDALKAARKNDRHVVLFFFSPSCPYCDLMEKETLTDRETVALLRQTALVARIDGDKRRDLARLYGVRAYPTTWLLEPTGARVAQIPGYISRQDFHTVISYLKGRHYRNSDLPTFASKQKQQP